MAVNDLFQNVLNRKCLFSAYAEF